MFTQDENIGCASDFMCHCVYMHVENMECVPAKYPAH